MISRCTVVALFAPTRVPHFHIAKLTLDDLRRVLDARTVRGHSVVETLSRRGSHVLLSSLERYNHKDSGIARQPFELAVLVALFAEHRAVIFVQQVRQRAGVRHIFRCHRDGMHESKMGKSHCIWTSFTPIA